MSQERIESRSWCFTYWERRKFLQVDSIIFDSFGQTRPIYPSKFAISLWHIKNDVRDLTALAGLNTFLTIYYTFSAVPPLILFVSQYGIHNKTFLHFINCFCNISSLLLQVTLGPCKLACFLRISIFLEVISQILWSKFWQFEN